MRAEGGDGGERVRARCRPISTAKPWKRRAMVTTSTMLGSSSTTSTRWEAAVESWRGQYRRGSWEIPETPRRAGVPTLGAGGRAAGAVRAVRGGLGPAFPGGSQEPRAALSGGGPTLPACRRDSCGAARGPTVPGAAPPLLLARPCPCAPARDPSRPAPSWSCCSCSAAPEPVVARARNGWANEYYSAAVRSMTESWHDFLFGSFDAAGVMTVDKPPLALWVQALSARAFGLSAGHPRAAGAHGRRRRRAHLGPDAPPLRPRRRLRRRSRARHHADRRRDLPPQQPGRLLVLLLPVVALWAVVRALEDGRTRWLVLAGAMHRARLRGEDGRRAARRARRSPPRGCGSRRRGRLASLRQLLAGGAAMVVVGGAWPLLVALTPAADRPWVSGTSDNSILVAHPRLQRPRAPGRPGRRAAGARRGRPGRRRWRRRLRRRRPGPLRLLNAALGGQAGWLARLRARRRASACRGQPAAPQRRAHGLADRRRRRVRDQRRRVQHAPRASSTPTTSPCSRRSRPPWSAAGGRAVLAGGRARADRRAAGHRRRRGRRAGVLVDTRGTAWAGCRRCSSPAAWTRPSRWPVGSAAKLRAGGGGARPSPCSWSRPPPGRCRRSATRRAGRSRRAVRRRRASAARPGGRRPGGGPAGGAAAAARRGAGPARALPPARARRRRGGGCRRRRDAGGFGGEPGADRGARLREGARRRHRRRLQPVRAPRARSSAPAPTSSAIGGFSGRESEVDAAWLAEAVESGKVRWVLTGRQTAASGPRRRPHRQPERHDGRRGDVSERRVRRRSV